MTTHYDKTCGNPLASGNFRSKLAILTMVSAEIPEAQLFWKTEEVPREAQSVVQ